MARQTVPVVREILSDRSDPRAQLLRGRVPVSQADITIIGPEFTCDRLVEQLSFRDLQDNVDARFVPDGLPLRAAGQRGADVLPQDTSR